MTPIQKRILWLLREHGEDTVACTGKGSRLNGFGAWTHKHGGLVIRAYSDPLYWMEAKGWLFRVTRNTPGHWYRLTNEGCIVADGIKTEPPAPRRNTRSTFGRRI